MHPEGKIYKIKNIYNGKNKGARLFASLMEGFFMVRKARKISREGLIIVMTDPPFLGFWSSILLRKRRWAHWSMDLYPEAFAAAKIVSSKNILYKGIKKLLANNLPHYLIALGECQRDYIVNEYKKSVHSIILPCGIARSSLAFATPFWRHASKIILGYCGNLGEAHSSEFLMKIIDCFDPNKYILIISVYGAKSGEILNHARNKNGVILLDRIDRSHLSFIDVHLVSLRPEWNNICVPSKAVSAVCEGRALIFCGDKKNDIWHYLHDAAWFVYDGPELEERIGRLLAEISPDSLEKKKQAATRISENLLQMKEESFRGILSFIKG